MTTLTPAMVDEIASRHPLVFAKKGWRSRPGWLAAGGAVLYLVFAAWYFSIGSVLGGANWSIAGVYLADWVSYETRPTIEFGDGGLEIAYPRFSAYRADRQPGWVTLEGESDPGIAGRIVVEMRSSTIDIVPGLVVIDHGGDRLAIDIGPGERVEAQGALPAWASQREPGGRITAEFGFVGRVDVEFDEVKVRQRFWGWENFVFDASSPFWGMSFGEVVATVLSSQRIDPERSNLSLAWNNFVNNAEWQHGDVWQKLLQTIVMAFAGTVLASLLAFPLAFFAARNITRSRLVNQIVKRGFDFLRAVDMFIWALFFTRAFGPGPLAGISAIFFTDTGTLGKLYAETLENIDDRQRDGVRSVGAAPLVVQRYGVVPQVMPVFLSQSLYFWESNTRSATIIGAVGAGGIGLKLWEAMRTNSDWENVAYMVLLILIVVYVFDGISTALRARLMGQR